MMNTWIIHNAGAGEGFYHVEYNREGNVVHVSGTFETLAEALGQAVAAGASLKGGPLEYRARPHEEHIA